jgi:hypothetical protein
VLRFHALADGAERRGLDEDEMSLGFDRAAPTSNNPTRRILSTIDLAAWLVELLPDYASLWLIPISATGAGVDHEQARPEQGASLQRPRWSCPGHGAVHAPVPAKDATVALRSGAACCHPRDDGSRRSWHGGNFQSGAGIRALEDPP